MGGGNAVHLSMRIYLGYWDSYGSDDKIVIVQPEIIDTGLSATTFSDAQAMESAYPAYNTAQTLFTFGMSASDVTYFQSKGFNLVDPNQRNLYFTATLYIEFKTNVRVIIHTRSGDVDYTPYNTTQTRAQTMPIPMSTVYTGEARKISVERIGSSFEGRTLTMGLGGIDIASEFWDLIPQYTPSSGDPYNQGGTTDQGGGEGDFDNTGDDIDVPDPPTISAVDARFISLYTPTLAELQSLASYMWGGLFDISTWKKIFADPMQAILGLSIVPVAVPTAGQQAVTVGNISTGISMTKASTQYVQVDCGILNVVEYWGAYLDYSPYTKLEIYLPYIGTKTLNIDDVMGRSIQCVYNIDVLTGACTAILKCGDSVLYQFAGSCSTQVPITNSDYSNAVSGVLGVAASAAALAVTAATGAGALATAYGAGQLLGAAGNAVMQSKPDISKSGGMASAAGMLGVQTPYLILTRPRQALPEDQSNFTGYPSYITSTLGDLTGFTTVESVHLEGISCTSAELAEIESLLVSGVIL